jgi:hypothetical protein
MLKIFLVNCAYMKKIYYLILPIIILMVSCTKEEPKEDPSKDTAGLGGAVEVIVFPTRNGSPIWSTTGHLDSAYVKFNTLEFPGADIAIYDMKCPSDFSEHIHVRGLKKGDYFFYVTALDTSTNQRVTGTMPFTLSSSEGIFHLNVPLNP